VVTFGIECVLQICTWVLIDGGVIHRIKLCFGFCQFGLDDGQAIESVDRISAVRLTPNIGLENLFHTTIVSVAIVRS
jgi:hypothetical protein